MDEVEYRKLDRWVWECPKCGDFNEEDHNPGPRIHVKCHGCGALFYPVKGD